MCPGVMSQLPGAGGSAHPAVSSSLVFLSYKGCPPLLSIGKAPVSYQAASSARSSYKVRQVNNLAWECCLGKIFQILGPGEEILFPGSEVEDRNRPYKLHQTNHYVSVSRHAWKWGQETEEGRGKGGRGGS